MKLLIGIPSGGAPAAVFVESLRKLQLPAEVTAIDQMTVTGNFVPGQRELILRRAVEMRVDFLLMLDDDMVIPSDAVEKLYATLVEHPDAALAGALYYGRDGIRPMIVGGWDAKDTTRGWIPAFRDDRASEVDGIGFGCVLLRVASLGPLRPPYCSTQVYIERAAARVRICNEDFLLSERLRQAGFRILLHGGVRCGHYVREAGRAMPERWESNAESDHRRMLILEDGPAYRLAPYDETVPRSIEVHERVHTEYLFVD